MALPLGSYRGVIKFRKKLPMSPVLVGVDPNPGNLPTDHRRTETLKMATATVIDRLLTPVETAEALGLKTQTLAAWRMTGKYQLPFVKFGPRIRYRETDIEKFLLAHRQTVTPGQSNSHPK